MHSTVAPAQGFMGASVATDLEQLDADIAFLGVPWGMPYHMGPSSSAAAPGYLRRVSSRFRRSLVGGHNFDFDGDLLDGRPVRIVDCGDVPGDPLDIPATLARATEAVRAVLSAGAVPVVFGGDDSIPIPVTRAYEAHGPIVVVQVDQHLDFKDEVGGVREGYSSPMRRISEMPWVSRVVQIGLSGVGSADASDVEQARAAGHLLFPERLVHEQGIAAVLEQVPQGVDYFITVDVDGLDPSIMPACTDTEPGGLTYAEAVDLLVGLAGTGRVVGMDVAEFAPAHDLHGLGARTVGRLILNLIHAMVCSGQFNRD